MIVSMAFIVCMGSGMVERGEGDHASQFPRFEQSQTMNEVPEDCTSQQEGPPVPAPDGANKACECPA